MRQTKLWMLLLITLALVNEWCHHCYGCTEEERIGLLEIKAWINHPSGSSLSFWVDNTEDSDCCKWYLVTCDTTTRRVVQLYLNAERASSDLYFNASLFLPFKELKSLYLGSNNLVGSFENQGFEVLASRLRKLEELDLSHNKFNDYVLSSLSGFSSLQSLDLSRNQYMTGSVPINGSRNLKILHLKGIDMKGSILIESLGALPSLKTLYATDSNLKRVLFGKGFYNSTSLEEFFLDYSSLPTNFLLNMGALPTLKVLSLKHCHLNGTLPAQGWCELKNLQQLYLTSTKLKGVLPACLKNLSSLQLLDVSQNQFVGNIGSSSLTNLTFLKYLDLSNNQFEIPVSFKSFMNHSNLKFLSCIENKLIVEPVSKSIIPKFQLKFFSLLNCISNSATSILEIPNFLHNQYDLRVLDLSHSNFSGMFPSWLFENNTRLEQLFLRGNFFAGTFQLPSHPNPNLLTIDIANNNIFGQSPRNICSIFPSLAELNIANNGLVGGTPTCFGNMSSLIILDLSNNQLSTVKLEQLTSLWYLKLSNNKLDGQVSHSVFNSSAWIFLYLNGNNLGGQEWDFSSINGLSLVSMDISNNRFSGMLPKWIGDMSKLETIDLSKNHFQGPIPGDFCMLDKLHYLDLSENNLSSSIPSCFYQLPLSHLHLSKNQLTGTFASSFSNLYYLIALDLSNNNFTGPIPSSVGDLSQLSVLLLKDNCFDGRLPVQLCMLQQLSILDVSKNNFSGALPSCLGSIAFQATHEKTYGKDVDPVAVVTNHLFDKSNFVSMGLPQVDDYYYKQRKRRKVDVDEGVEFTTKRNSYIYRGDILNFMSGMDLSCNKFSGAIPPEFGKLEALHALNLSHNNFTGSLPATFSKLNQIESLDLSYNGLTGIIPPELTEITTLAVFSMAYNNLSGKTPERKNQFGTFDESSYEGNPLLCGPPLKYNCNEEKSPSHPMLNDDEEDDDFIDMDVFYVSFGVCYIIVVLTIAVVLYINPYWRRRWFYFLEEFIDTCYYFVVDSFRKISITRRT